MMGKTTGISWCDHTFNPWIGCTKVSPGCANCYAERENNLFKWTDGWGPTGTRKRTSVNYWKEPIAWATRALKEGVTRRIFSASLADVFEGGINPNWVYEFFNLVDLTGKMGGVEWLILTKRPENIYSMLPVRWLQNPPPYVRIGVTAENQMMADIRIPELLHIWKGKNFVSYEPAVGALSFRDVPGLNRVGNAPGVDWVICGGESGPDARPMHPAWVRKVRNECETAGVPFFFKQWGEWAPVLEVYDYAELHDHIGIISFLKSGSLFMPVNGEVTSEALEIGPEHKNIVSFENVGRKKSGDFLDGRQYKEFPKDGE